MVTYTLKDSGPTTTITFDAFTIIGLKVISQDQQVFAYPENEGVEVIFLGQNYKHFSFSFEFKDGGGKTAYEKLEELVDLIITGGDNEWLFIITFTKPDESGTESHTGRVRNLDAQLVGGEHVALVEGEFEFIEDTITGS